MATQLEAPVIAVLNERAADAAARRLETRFARAGRVSGEEFQKAFDEEVSRSNLAADDVGRALQQRMSRFGAQSGRGFGSSFGSELAQSLPVVGGFASAMAGYEGVAGKAGAAAGRALGMAFTTAAAGVIGAAGYTIFKGFERYEAIDAARNRLENLNRTMAATGRQAIDVGAVMDVVNQSVMDTPFALDQAFSIATRALASNTGDLRRFMGVVTDAAGFAGAGVDEIGEAFLKVANRGKVSMEEISNELRNIPVLPWLQQELGVTGNALAKMISDGKVGLEDLMRAIETNASGFAKSAGDTVAGAMENAQTAVARLGANFLGAIFGKPTEDANDLVEVLKVLRQRIDDVNAYVTAHAGDIKQFFETAVQVGGDVVRVLGQISEVLIEHPSMITAVVAAFAAWKTITGVSTLITSLNTISTTLGTTIPASATKGGAGIAAAFGKGGAAFAALVSLGALIDEIDTKLQNEKFNNPVFTGPHGNVTPSQWELRAYDDPAELERRHNWLLQYLAPKLKPGEAFDQLLNDPTAWTRVGMTSAPWGVDGKPDQPTWNSVVPGGGNGPHGRRTPAGPSGMPILPAPGNGDGGGGEPKLPDAPVVPYAELPPIDPRLQMTASLFGMQTSVADAMTRAAEKRARLNQLEQSNVATADDILNAENELIKAERESEEAKMRFIEAQNKALEQQNKNLDKLSGDLGQFGAQIDEAFGAADGLPGIAENIVKFLANLAFAPAYGALSAVQSANGFKRGEAGSGLFGMAASSGLFGPDLVPTSAFDRAASSGSTGGYSDVATSIPMTTLPGLAGGGQPYGLPANTDIRQGQGGFPPWVYQLGQAFGIESSTYAGHQTGRGVNQGIDWWPAGNAQMYPGATGYNADELARMDAFAEWIGQQPGVEQVIWKNPATGRTVGYANGERVGPGTSQPQYYAKDWAGHTGHVHTRHASAPGVPGGGSDAGPPPGIGNSGAGTGMVGPGMAGPPQSPFLGGPGFPGLTGGPAAPSQSVAGGRQFGQGLPPSGGVGFSGGLIGSLMSAAMSAAGSASGAAGAGGGAGGAAASAAAEIGMQLLGRAAGAAGQYAGAAAGGLLETFSLNDSALADPGRSWLGRLMIAGAGMRPALPNTAGALGGKQNENMAEGGQQPPPPMSPEQAAAAQAAGLGQHGAANGAAPGPGGDTYKLTVNRYEIPARGDMASDAAGLLSAANAARQPR